MDEPPSHYFAIILLDQSLLYISAMLLLLFCAAWTSAVEAAFFSLGTDDRDKLRNSRDVRDRVAVSIVADPRRMYNMLATVKFAVLTFAATITAIFFELTSLPSFVSNAGISATVIMVTVAFAIFGVIVPKIQGRKNAFRIVRRNSRICLWLVDVSTPILRPLLRSSSNIERKLDEKVEEKTVEQMTQALQLATVDNEPIEGEKEILEGVVTFGTLTVKQVMRPKAEISYTDSSLRFHELLDYVKRSGYSRIPICRGSLDSIEGVLYIKDLLPFLDQNNYFAWQKLLRPAYFVPETKKVDVLLKDFQEKRVHIAVVVNHTGNTTGLITLEDIIEEIIGDINDEFDELGIRYQRLPDGALLFDGKISLHEFCKVLSMDPIIFHRVKGINESLGGVLMEVNERLPQVGEEIIIEPFTFIIEAVDHKRIKKVKVVMHENEEK